MTKMLMILCSRSKPQPLLISTAFDKNLMLNDTEEWVLPWVAWLARFRGLIGGVLPVPQHIFGKERSGSRTQQDTRMFGMLDEDEARPQAVGSFRPNAFTRCLLMAALLVYQIG